jgi:hypothetical protein
MGSGFFIKTTLTDYTVSFEELQVKHLKVIYKTLLGDDLNPEIIFTNINNILQNTTNLKDKILSLNYLDYILLLLNIRAASIGNLIILQLNQEENIKIEIDVYKLIDIIEKEIKNIIPEPQNINTVKIHFTLPTVHELLTLTSKSSINDVYNFFIKTLEYENTFIKLKEIPQHEKITLLEKIPAKITSQIIKITLDIIQKLNTINIFHQVRGLEDKTLFLNLNTQNLVAFIKLLFGEQLMALYENIFALCKMGNFTPEYLENCTPGEYLLFVKKLEALNKPSQEENTRPVENYDPMAFS